MTRIDSETKHEPKLLFRGLKSFYEMAVPLAWPIVRVAVGWNLLVHGWGKVSRGGRRPMSALSWSRDSIQRCPGSGRR